MSKSNRDLFFSLYWLFFLVGISTILVGQVLPMLAQKLSLSDSESSRFFIAHFAGSLSGIFLYNHQAKKSGFVRTILIGILASAVGVLLLNADSQAICMIGFFLNGICTGANIPAVNMLVAKLSPLRVSSSLNFLNFFWGLGAILSQPFFYFLSDNGRILVPTILLSASYLSAFVLIFPYLSEEKTTKAETEREVFRGIWKNPIAWMIAFFNFAHVGLESGIGGWLTTYSERFTEKSLISATPVFFIFFVLGRAIAPVMVEFFADNNFIFFSLLILLVGLMVIIFSSSYEGLLLGAGICGIGTSAIFPTNMARFAKIFHPEATKSATPIFVMGSFGGAATTYLIGYFSDYFKSLKMGILVLFANTLILIALQILILSKIRVSTIDVKQEDKK